jgi:hypothetical protein
MAKKVRRVRKTIGDNQKEVTADAKAALKTKLNPEEQFRQEYAYVLKDLRQVLLLAVVMFALLILLNVVLR